MCSLDPASRPTHATCLSQSWADTVMKKAETNSGCEMQVAHSLGSGQSYRVATSVLPMPLPWWGCLVLPQHQLLLCPMGPAVQQALRTAQTALLILSHTACTHLKGEQNPVSFSTLSSPLPLTVLLRVIRHGCHGDAHTSPCQMSSFHPLSPRHSGTATKSPCQLFCQNTAVPKDDSG